VKHDTLFKKLITSDENFIEATIETNNLSLNLTQSNIPKKTGDMFNKLTKELNLIETFKTFFKHNNHNKSENKSVNHHQLRSNTNTLYSKEINQLIEFINTIHTSNNITDVVQIGIGGSYLGPKAVYEALLLQPNTPIINGHFVANIDPIEFKSCIHKLNPKKTLFILASKSGDTMEIAANINLLKEWWKSHNLTEDMLKNHCISLTMQGSPLDSSLTSANRFYIDSSIGGRFATTSIIGMCIIGLCFGNKAITELLSGAKFMDENAQLPTYTQNLSLAAAWEHIWQRNIKHYNQRAIIAYSYSLQSFPIFFQQLTCESNGKSVDNNGNKIPYKTAPMIIPGIGTNSQHSFFQLLHQGSDIIPVDFIGVKNQHKQYTYFEKQSHSLLNANIYAQMQALQQGEQSTDKRYICEGKKPSTLLLLDTITPYSIGQLIAFYENKTIFEGLIWNINSFDQIGVQLGKKLTKNFIKTS
tara:strand:- start:7825 stop:9240 length:1416 start_codon:yes stop_codon:yes gene_type:complete